MGAGTIKTTLTLDASKFTSALEKATENLDVLDSSLESASKMAKDFEKSVGGLGGNLASSVDKFKLLDQTLSKFISNLNKQASGYEKAASGSRALKKATDDLAGSAKNLDGAAATTINKIKGLSTAMESIKASTQQAVKGNDALIVSNKRVAESAELSAADQVRASIKALEAMSAAGDKEIAIKEANARRLLDVEKTSVAKANMIRLEAQKVASRKQNGTAAEAAGMMSNSSGQLNAAKIAAGEAAAIQGLIEKLRTENQVIAQKISLKKEELSIAIEVENAEDKASQRAIVADAERIRQQKELTVYQEKQLALQRREEALVGKRARQIVDDASPKSMSRGDYAKWWEKSISGRDKAEAGVKEDELKKWRDVENFRLASAKRVADEERSQAQSIAQMWKSMAGLYAASKIEKGFGASINAANEMEVQKVKVSALGYDAAHNKEIIDSAFSMSKSLGFISTLDAIKSRMSAIASLGKDDKGVIEKTLTTAVKVSNNLSTMGFAGHEDMQTVIRNLYGVVEMRQQTANPTATNNTFELMQKIITGTQGKVQTQDMETVLRRLGMGAGQLSDSGMINLAAIVDQFKVAGGEGGGGGASGVSTVGTSFKMMQAYALGKTLTNKAVEEFSGAGVMGTNGIDFSKDSAHVLKKSKNGGFNDKQLWLNDPVAAVQKMIPKVIAYTQEARNKGKYYEGKDTKSQDNQLVAVASYLASLGMTTSSITAMITAGDPRSQKRIADQHATIQNADGSNEVDAKLKETYSRNMQDVKASATDLATFVGATLLPVVKDVLQTFGKVLSVAKDFSHDNPIATQGIAIAVAWEGVFMSFKSVTGLFGYMGNMSKIAKALAGGSREIDLAAKGASSALTGEAAAANAAAIALEKDAAATALAARSATMMGASVKEVAVVQEVSTARTLAASVATTALSGATKALSVGLSLIGGPLGLIVGALTLGTLAWEKWGNAAQKARLQAAEDTKSIHDGGNSQELVDRNTAGAADNQYELKTIREHLKGNEQKSASAKAAGYDSKALDANSAALRAEITRREALAVVLANEATVLKDNINTKKKNDALDAKEIAARANALNDPKVQAELAKSEKEASAKPTKAQLDKITPDMAGLFPAGKTRDTINVSELNQMLGNDRINAAANAPGKEKRGFENPLEMYLANAAAKARVANSKLGSAEGDGTSYARQAKDTVFGLVSGGKFDRANDPKNRNEYLRKGYTYDPATEQYYRGSGKRRVASNAQEAIDFNRKDKAGHTLNDAVSSVQGDITSNDMTKGMKTAGEMLAATMSTLSESLQTLNGGVKISAAEMAIRKEHARLEAGNPAIAAAAADPTSQYSKDKSSELFAQRNISLNDEIIRLKAAHKDKRGPLERMASDGAQFTTKEQVAGAKFDDTKNAEMSRLGGMIQGIKDDLANLKSGNIAADAAKGLTPEQSLQSHSAEYAAREKLIADSEKAQTELVASFAKKREDIVKTSLQTQADLWANSVDQVQGLKTKWAGEMMGGLQTLVNGHNKDGTRLTGAQMGYNLRAGAASMFRDSSNMLVQRATGGMVSGAADMMGNGLTSMFGLNAKTGLGGMLGGMFGGAGSKKDGSTAASALYVSDVSGTSSITGSTSALGDPQQLFFSKLSTGFNGVWTSLSTMLSSLGSGLMSVFRGVSGGGGGSGGMLGIGGMFSMGSGSAAAAGGGAMAGDASAVSSFASMAATGGITGPNSKVPVTGHGLVSFKAYAGGGIATAPQLSLFGEAGPEAYVPLPDGRTIPVTMKGGASSAASTTNESNTTQNQGGHTVNIVINHSSSGGADTTSSSGSTGANTGAYGNLANGISALVRKELISQQQPGGMLYK